MGDSVSESVAAVSNTNCTVLVEADFTVTVCVGVALPCPSTFPTPDESVTVYAPVGSYAKNAHPSAPVVAVSETPAVGLSIVTIAPETG